MATLNTMRAILKDERLRRQSSHIRAELDLLYKDMLRLEGRIINLDKHFNLASKDVDEIKPIITMEPSSVSVKEDTTNVYIFNSKHYVIFLYYNLNQYLKRSPLKSLLIA